MARRFAALAGLVSLLVIGCDPAPANKPGKGSDPGKPATGEAAKSPGAGEKTIYFITNSDSTFWDAAEKGAVDAGKELGVRIEFLRNKPGTADGQIQLLDRILEKPDALGVVVSVVEASSSGITDRFEELQNKKVTVLTFDSDTAAAKRRTRSAYVGTNNVEAGKVAGEVAQLLLPEGGKVVGFVGTTDADNARERVEGFKAGAGAKFTVAEVMSDGVDRVKARQNVDVALEKHKDLKIPLGIYSYNAPQIAEAVKAANARSRLKVLTFDAEEQTMTAIKEGLIDATIVQNTYDMGAVSAKLAHALSTGNKGVSDGLLKGTDRVDTGVRVIVPDNSALKGKKPQINTQTEFADYMKAKGLKST
jgi:ribose transport system substrate-binding protein